MGQRSADSGEDYGDFLAPWETDEHEDALKRFRMQEGLPVLNFRQLVDLSPRQEELFIFTTVYDRFSAGLTRPVRPEPRP
jgi:hypothetical protein